MTESRVTALHADIGLAEPRDSRFTLLDADIGISEAPLSRFTLLDAEVGILYEPTYSGGSRQLWPRGGEAIGSATPGGAAGGDLDDTYPDPTVVGLRGRGIAATAPTDGQGYLYNSTSGLWEPSTVGSPAVKYTYHDPFIPDASPHALNEEFDSNSFANFTEVYITGEAGVTVDIDSTAPGWAWFELPVQLYRFRSLMKALPGDTNFTIHTVMAIGFSDTTGGAAWPGLGLCDSVTPGAGSLTIAGFNNSPGYHNRHKVTWSGYGNTAAGAVGANYGGGNGGGRCYVRFRREAGVYYIAWSTDPEGLVWYEVTTTLLGSITPSYFGILANNYSSSVGRVAFGYLRYYANGTQLLTGGTRNVYA